MASDEDLRAQIDRLRAENEALKKPARGKMSLKVTEKGGLFAMINTIERQPEVTHEDIPSSNGGR